MTNGPTLIRAAGRQCWSGTRPTGEPDVYKCRAAGTVVWGGRFWCELHDPITQAIAAAVLLLSRKAA